MKTHEHHYLSNGLCEWCGQVKPRKLMKLEVEADITDLSKRDISNAIDEMSIDILQGKTEGPFRTFDYNDDCEVEPSGTWKLVETDG